MCVVLGVLNSITFNLDGRDQTLLAFIAKAMTPVFSPMGITSENWPATVGLLTGMLAKEVVVGTLNSLYSQMAQVSVIPPESFSVVLGIKQALLSIPENLSNLGQALKNPFLASAPDNEVAQSVYGVMGSQFLTKGAAYAYLVFILLYVPCVSTMVVIRQESNKYWMIFSVVWSTLLAYAAATFCYQFSQRPRISIVVSIVMALAIYSLFKLVKQRRIHGGRYDFNPY